MADYKNFPVGKHDDDKIIREILRNDGIKGVNMFLQRHSHEFRIAVTGQTGTGKSSFVNALRGLKADDFMAAPVGIVETTKTVMEYIHPENKNLFIYDLPGIGGSLKFSRENFLDEVQFSRFDFYIIISSSRFTELDVFLARKVQDLEKKFYFIRSKIDYDLRNEKMDYPLTYQEETVLSKIREDCVVNLNHLLLKPIDSSKVFLVNNFDPDQHDFPRLKRCIVADAPFIKLDMRENLFSFILNEFYGTLKKNAKIEAGPLAMKSTLEGNVRIPSTSVSINIKCIKDGIEDFKQAFSLQDKDLAEFANLLDIPVNELSNTLNLKTFSMDFSEDGIIAACAEQYPRVKVNWPLIGPFFSSRSVVKTYLEKVVDLMTDDAIKISMTLMSKTRNEFSQSTSTML